MESEEGQVGRGHTFLRTIAPSIARDGTVWTLDVNKLKEVGLL